MTIMEARENQRGPMLSASCYIDPGAETAKDLKGLSFPNGAPLRIREPSPHQLTGTPLAEALGPALKAVMANLAEGITRITLPGGRLLVRTTRDFTSTSRTGPHEAQEGKVLAITTGVAGQFRRFRLDTGELLPDKKKKTL